MDNNEKDALFYNDLIYELKKYAGFYAGYDEEIEARIERRKKYDIEMNNEVMISIVSEFNAELYTSFKKIMIMADNESKDFNEIAKYPDLVKKEIHDLENKINSLNCEKTHVKILRNKSLHY